MNVVEKYTYLDTSALMRRAELLGSEPLERSVQIGSVLSRVFADPLRKFGCSELTLLEFHSNVTTLLRSSSEQFDQVWWDRALAELMADLASGKIVVLEAPPKAAEHVMSLVTVATGTLGRALKAWDAMHAVVAAKWAEDSGQAVTILTSDADFGVALEVMVGFGQLEIENLDMLASTGHGADRRSV